MCNKPDKYEKFLTGDMTIRRFCSEIGFDDIAYSLGNELFAIQDAHSNMVRREAKRMVLNIVRAFQEGKIGKGKRITDAQLAEWLGLTRKELRALDNLRSAPPP